MSLASWKKEFYPEPIRDYSLDALTAAKHSLQKWIGLRAENLNRHGVYQKDGHIYFGHSVFYVGEGSCSLCLYANERLQKHPESIEEIPEREYFMVRCYYCPLAEFLSRKYCSSSSPENPYYLWMHKGNPVPMIAALEKTVRTLEAAEKMEESSADA